MSVAMFLHFGLLLCLVLYILPAMIASGRKHNNAAAICTLNLLLGWTVVGWITSLIWALTNPPQKAE